MKKTLICVLSTLIGTALGTSVVACLIAKDIKKEREITNRFTSYYNLLNQWVMLKNEGKSLASYLLDNEYKSVAIYGMGEIGMRLYEELKETSIKIKYAIDKNADSLYSELDILTMDDELEEVDAIIVSVPYAFDEIAGNLRNRVNSKIISIEDIVFEL